MDDQVLGPGTAGYTGVSKTSEELCISRVQAVLALMNDEWVCATYAKDVGWRCWLGEPGINEEQGIWGYNLALACSMPHLNNFNLPPFPGDWKESLVRRKE